MHSFLLILLRLHYWYNTEYLLLLFINSFTIETTITPKRLNEIYKKNKRLKQEVEILKEALYIMTTK